MRATTWEFNNRVFVFALIFGVGFAAYWIDHQNASVALADALSMKYGVDADRTVRLLLAVAAVLAVGGALIRTWASSFLHADVVYATDVKTAALVADGPYRHVRNPLYLGNVLMALAMGLVMSRLGFAVAFAGMLVFCYRLILREEDELLDALGERYDHFRDRVPRLFPALRPQLPSAGGTPQWADGFKSESWYWGFALALISFAVTLNQTMFFTILAASLAVFWILTAMNKRASGDAPAG